MPKRKELVIGDDEERDPVDLEDDDLLEDEEEEDLDEIEPEDDVDEIDEDEDFDDEDSL